MRLYQAGIGLLELCQQKQLVQMAIIMIGIQTQFGIMILEVGEELALPLTEMTAALSVYFLFLPPRFLLVLLPETLSAPMLL
jgi:hypothetical protein